MAAKKRKVAIVDDDAGLRGIMRVALEMADYEVFEGRDGNEAVELARGGEIEAMVLDVRMPNMTGLEALEIIKRDSPGVAVLLLTAYIDLRDAIAAIKTGANDYLEKPIDLDELVVAVDEALDTPREETLFTTSSHEVVIPPNIVAESPLMLASFHEAMRVAPTNASVLIMGESGTGKEVLANFIHQNSTRKDGPMVAVNCAALPENLIESELFGHEKGSFTGAANRKSGRFEEASGGTIFLDEIGEMPLSLQPKLLRALEEKTIRRVGGMRDFPVDIRVIAATNRPLEEDAREGRFREDLLYRLNVFALRLPALCERTEDVPALVEHFLSVESSGGKPKKFSPAAMRLLMDYTWPGNVRELRNAVVRSSILTHGSLILPENLPEAVRRAKPLDTKQGEEAVSVGSMEEVQKRAILEALEQTNGNKSQAAKVLGISRRNLIYKLRSYGM